MPTRPRSAPKIRVRRPTTGALRRVTLVRDVNGRRTEREVGRRDWLSVDEAAAVLKRPAAAVLESIRATPAACDSFLAEEAADWKIIRRTRGQRLYPAEQVHAELGL